jgi:hypothetical protein
VTGGLRGVRRWSDSELEADARTAAAEFRRRRMAEPLQRYLGAFDDARPAVAAWVEVLDDVLGPAPPQRLAEGLSSETGRIAFRYLGAPPISQDDLETLAERRFASAAGALGDDQAAPLREVMRAIVDPRRFPWLAEERAATPCELDAGVLATTALMASQKVQTLRRSDEKAAVEGAVRGLLVGLGWQQAQPRSARGVQVLVADAPGPRCFFVQANLGSDNADVIVRLDDGRLLAIECKGSNSAINSRKRLNKEASQNARAWLAAFGAEQVIPAVALQGVFNPRYVAEAQGTPLAVFWSHRLDDLREFLSGRG